MESARPPILGRVSRTAIFATALILATSYVTSRYFVPIAALKLGAIAAAALAFALYIFANPKHGLYIIVFYIYGGLGFYAPFSVSQPIVAIITVAVLMRLLRGEPIEFRSAGFLWGMAIFVMLCVQSMLYAHEPSLSMFELTEVAKAMLVVFLVVQLIRTPRDLHRFVLAIFLGALASVLLGIVNYQFGLITAEQVTPGEMGIRFTGTHGNANEFATFLVTAVVIGVYLARKFHRWYSRLFIILACIAMLFATFASFSRAAFIIIAFSLVMIVTRDGRNRYVLAAIIVTVGLSFILTPLTYWDRITTLAELGDVGTDNWSLYTRLQSAAVAWKMFLESPLTGVGYGNFILRSEPYFFHRMVVHSIYLQLLVGLGIFGLLTYLAVQVSTVGHFVGGMRTRWRAQSDWMPHLCFYLLVGYLSTIVSGLFGTSTFEYVTWLPAAGGLAAGRIAVRMREGRLEEQQLPEAVDGGA